ISLYQMGIIRHLPDLPGRWFHADKVDASREAYSVLSTPDAALGLASYSVTAVLAAMAGGDRARRHPWLPISLAAKLVLDALAAGKLTLDQWLEHRAFCVWCLIAAGSTFLALPL